MFQTVARDRPDKVVGLTDRRVAIETRTARLKLNGERHHDHRPSLRCDELEAVLIYSMSVSVDGFIAVVGP
jgi:hypothetical protein